MVVSSSRECAANSGRGLQWWATTAAASRAYPEMVVTTATSVVSDGREHGVSINGAPSSGEWQDLVSSEETDRAKSHEANLFYFISSSLLFTISFFVVTRGENEHCTLLKCQDEQPQLSQPVFIGVVLQSPEHLCGTPLDLLKQVHVFPVPRTPELEVALQVSLDGILYFRSINCTTQFDVSCGVHMVPKL
ncbi:hypothetical protein BTVI_04055 [Pitangus sulphuratus]|nr:hypothetical protein BTVI_04055 [Pitangus sulphuratus]